MNERPHSNTRHAVRDSDRSQTFATRERIISNTRYAIRDSNGNQARAIAERIIPNTRHTVRDSDGSQRGATKKRFLSNTRYTIRNRDRGEGAAYIKSILSNTRYAVGSTIVGDGRRDSDRTGVFVVFTRPPPTEGHLYFVGFVGKDVVVYTIYFKIFCPDGGGCHEGKKECEKFFHIVRLLVNIRL